MEFSGNMFKSFALVTLLVTLWACMDGSDDSRGQLAEAKASSEQLTQRYDQYCEACHGENDAAATGARTPMTGAPMTEAPKTGDVTAWKARLEARGLMQLLKNTQQGMAHMPAKGGCDDCTDQQLKALILFMSTGK